MPCSSCVAILTKTALVRQPSPLLLYNQTNLKPMKRFNKLAATLFLAFFAATFGLQAHSTNSPEKAIYAFGFSTSLADSTVYLTPISSLPGASIDKKTHFLNDRAEYTQQVKTYLESLYPGHQTSVIFFNVSRKKLESQYVKVRRTAKKNAAYKVVELESNAFKFSAAPQEATE